VRFFWFSAAKQWTRGRSRGTSLRLYHNTIDILAPRSKLPGMESEDERLSKRQGAREMWIAGLVITLSMVFALVVVALIVIFGHIQLN
jgi:hypothetical protein